MGLSLPKQVMDAPAEHGEQMMAVEGQVKGAGGLVCISLLLLFGI